MTAPMTPRKRIQLHFEKPLCGATDGPWSARAFEFTRLTCHERQSIVLDPEHIPA